MAMPTPSVLTGLVVQVSVAPVAPVPGVIASVTGCVRGVVAELVAGQDARLRPERGAAVVVGTGLRQVDQLGHRARDLGQRAVVRRRRRERVLVPVLVMLPVVRPAPAVGWTWRPTNVRMQPATVDAVVTVNVACVAVTDE